MDVEGLELRTSQADYANHNTITIYHCLHFKRCKQISEKFSAPACLDVSCLIDATEIKVLSVNRWSHTSIPPGIYKRDKKCKFHKTANGAAATRLCSVWWDSQVRL